MKTQTTDKPSAAGALEAPAAETAKSTTFPMNIESLTIGEARAIAALFQGQLQTAPASNPFEIGKNYFIRTVTHHLTGKLIEVYPTELVLVDAAWIADDGRLADALKSEEFSEVEPFPDDRRVIVNRASLIDAQTIKKLPRSQK
jgi:hypothetical protein